MTAQRPVSTMHAHLSRESVTNPETQPRTVGAVERFAPLVAGLCLALPTVAFRYPPMVDLPYHQGLVAILRHFDDPALFPPGLYLRNLGHCNQLFYFLSWALSYVCGVELACKIVAGATIVAILMSAARLAAYLDGSRWVALLLGPVALGWLYYWGLIANLMGVAALLAMLPTLDRLAERPTGRRALAAMGGCLLMYETHELMLIVYAGAALVFAAGHELRGRDTTLRILPFFGCLALTAIDHLWTTHIATPIIGRSTVVWGSLGRKLYTIPGALFGGQEPPLLYSTTALSALALALLLTSRVKASASFPRSAREAVHRYRFELFALACFALYLALPSNVHGATIVYHRFIGPAYAVFVVCSSARGTAARVRTTTALVTAALPLAALFTLFPIIADVSSTARDVDKLIAEMQPESSVAMLDLGPTPKQPRNSTNLTLGARVLTAHGGRMLFAFAISPVAPALYAPRYDWDEPLRRTMFDHFAFSPAHDFTRFRYLLIHTTSAALTIGVTVAVAPEARFVDTAGDWTLFESNLATAPLLSADVPLPSPRPETLRERLNKLMSRGEAPLAPTEMEPVDPARLDDHVRPAPATN